MINLNYSLLIQAGLFIFLMLVLNRLLFKPFLRFLDERQNKISGDEREAARLQEAAERSRFQFEEGLNKGQLKALEEKVRIQDAGANTGKQLIDAVRQEVDEEIPRVKAQVTKESQTAMAELERRQGAIARDIAEKLLGRSLQ